MAPAHPAYGTAAHGIEEGLHTLLITAFRCLAVHVLHRNHALWIQLIHQRRSFFGVVELAAAPYADDQHIGVAQQHPVSGRELSSDAQLQFSEPQGWALVRELLKFDAVIAEVEEELLPNRLCSYLFELSQVFNRFYDQVPVLKADPEALPSRLALCRLTADTLKQGLGLLGIATLERM